MGPHEIITRHTRPRTRGRRTAPLIMFSSFAVYNRIINLVFYRSPSSIYFLLPPPPPSQQSFAMRIEAYDHDSYNDHDYVDFYYFNFANVIPTVSSNLYYTYGHRAELVSGIANTVLYFRYGVYCNTHWYGSDCNTECVPVTGRYTCNSNGGRVCEPGWQGASCDNGTW